MSLTNYLKVASRKEAQRPFYFFLHIALAVTAVLMLKKRRHRRQAASNEIDLCARPPTTTTKIPEQDTDEFPPIIENSKPLSMMRTLTSSSHDSTDTVLININDASQIGLKQRRGSARDGGINLRKLTSIALMAKRLGTMQFINKRTNVEATPTAVAAISAFFRLAKSDPFDGSQVPRFITPKAFVTALRDELRLNLTNEEAGRLFHQFDRRGDGRLSLTSFLLVVRDSVFLRRVVSSLQYPLNVKVPKDYDFSKPTYVNHKHPQYIVDTKWNTSSFKKYDETKHGPLYGQFQSVRRLMDYGWHTNYTKERQAWQDELVNKVALRHRPVRWPWLVLTCGAMGAGKGYVLRWLSRTGVFPLDNIVNIDPDHFKSAMPEWEGYKKISSEDAGTLTHKESGFIQEIAQDVSLQGRQNTWIDGSLQDYSWWSQWITNVRQRLPHYRIAIFYVYARTQQVIDRANARGHETGRIVPVDTLLESIRKSAKAIDKLGPMVDFVARLDNSCINSAHPILDTFEDHSHSLRAIADHFRSRVDPVQRFPESLGPLRLLSAGVDITSSSTLQHDTFFYKNSHDGASLGSARNYNWTLDPSIWDNLVKTKEQLVRLNVMSILCSEKTWRTTSKDLVEILSSMLLILSPCAEVTLDTHSRGVAGIPPDADLFCWCHGASKDGYHLVLKEQVVLALQDINVQKTSAHKLDDRLRAEKIIDCNPLLQFLFYGGFLYFNTNSNSLVAINASVPNAKMKTQSVPKRMQKDHDASFLSHMTYALQFTEPQRIPRTFDLESRWVEVVDNALLDGGATNMAWLLPGELPICPAGAFAFRVNRYNTRSLSGIETSLLKDNSEKEIEYAFEDIQKMNNEKPNTFMMDRFRTESTFQDLLLFAVDVT